MKRFEIVFEIRVKGEAKVWDTDVIQLTSSDLFGAIQEASAVLKRLQDGYGEAYELKSWVKERKAVA